MPLREFKKKIEQIVPFFFDHYCATFRCKMTRKACLARQCLAIKRKSYRLNANTCLVSNGFYPECHACLRGRQVARASGIDLRKMRKELSALRAQIEESDLISTYSFHRCNC